MQIDLKLQQKQTLSHSQIQALHVLAFDAMELDQFLHDEYLENPLLDYTEKTPAITDHYTGPVTFLSDSSGSIKDTPSPAASQPGQDDIYEFLLSQLDISKYNKYEWNLIKYLIDCLDDNGYFSFSTEDICAHIGADRNILEKCLEDLRHLEPAGIFSSDLPSCLISQLDPADDGFEPMRSMILDHMEDIATGRISSISRNLKLPTAQVRKYMDRIKTLDPRPLAHLLAKKEPCIFPDIILTCQNGDWTISLNDNWVENYQINDYYASMMRTTKDPELTAYFEERLARVQFLFSCIEQRRRTLLSIGEKILEHQKDYFLSKAPLAPMTMSALAQELSIHPSTFGRALRGKYIQSPRGTILCKNLFSAAAAPSEDTQEGWSQTEIKKSLQNIIAEENKAKPYSDQKLVKLLAAQGVSISRRAIAKYRQELGIGSSVDRKES